MFGAPGGQARAQASDAVPPGQPEQLQPFPQAAASHGFLHPPQFLHVPPEFASPHGHQGAAHYPAVEIAYRPPSLGSPTGPPFRPQPLSPGPVPPFPPPTPPYQPPPPLSHSPPRAMHPVSLQHYPQFVPSSHLPLHHHPGMHPAVLAQHYHTVPQSSYHGIVEPTFPLSHPAPAFAPVHHLQHPMVHPCPTEVPGAQFQRPHRGDRQPRRQRIVRPIPIYRAPAPEFEAMIRQRMGSHTQPHPPVTSIPQTSSTAEGQTSSTAEGQTSSTTEAQTSAEQEEEEAQSPHPPPTEVELDPMEGSSTAQQMDAYREFAAVFKDHRIELGYTEADFSQQVGLRYGYAVSEDDVKRFESMSLTVDEVMKLKDVFETWLRDTAKAAGKTEDEIKEMVTQSEPTSMPKRPRKSRTLLTPMARDRLELEFRSRPKPSQTEMGALAEDLGVEKAFVRIWFCNRRQREKKRKRKRGAATLTISSPSHDITLEVPGDSASEGSGASSADVYISQPTVHSLPFEDM